MTHAYITAAAAQQNIGNVSRVCWFPDPYCSTPPSTGSNMLSGRIDNTTHTMAPYMTRAIITGLIGLYRIGEKIERHTAAHSWATLSSSFDKSSHAWRRICLLS